MEPAGSSSSNTKVTNPFTGQFPLQCDSCGREYVNLCCQKCSPYKAPIERNRAGFPKYGGLSPKKSAARFSPTSPRKRGLASIFPNVIRRVQFKGYTRGGLMRLEIQPGEKGTVIGGHQMPFARRVKEGYEFIVLTKFQYGSHKWETDDVPCHRETPESVLFGALIVHFRIFVKEMKKCKNSHACLCGGPDSFVTLDDVKILGYKLLILNETFVIEVTAGSDV